MHECLIASGFLEEKLGEAQPPAAHYRLVSAETGFYADLKRFGERWRTVRLRAGPIFDYQRTPRVTAILPQFAHFELRPGAGL